MAIQEKPRQERVKPAVAILMVVVAALLLVFSLKYSFTEKDHDPHEHIDAPGYYNGPMTPRGANGKASATGDKAPMPPGKGK